MWASVGLAARALAGPGGAALRSQAMGRHGLALSLVLALSTPAAGAGKGKAPAKPPPAAPPAAAPAAPAATGGLADVANAELIARARAQFDQLEYEAVLPLVVELLARGDGVPVEMRLDAYVLEGSCRAIVGDPIDAEKPFRALLRGRPDFELSADTPPKIMAVFRKVQAEEKAIVFEMGKLTRDRHVREMDLIGTHPTNLKGGRPAVFSYLLKDPNGAASAVRVQYRKKGEPSFSSLALLREEATGRWRGMLPGEVTANESGAELEFFVETTDAAGPLLTRGSASEPLRAALAPGQVDHSDPPPLPPWAIWIGAGTSGALLAAGGAFGAGVLILQQQYDAQGELAVSVPQQGSDMKALANTGTAFSWTANSLFVASGVAAVTTLAAGLFFTDWEGRAAQLEEEAPIAAVTPVAR